MANSANLLKRLDNRFDKTITFDGLTGKGLVDVAVAIATITGSVLIKHLTVRCTTLLTGATTTIEMGTANSTAALIAQITATALDADEWWFDATPIAEVGSAVVDKMVNADIIITPTSGAGVTGGVIEIVALWVPLPDDGRMS